MNNVSIMGNLTRDPETKQFTNNSITKFCLAVNKSVKEGDKWVDKAVFIDCKMWGKRGEAFARFHKQGDQACITRGTLDVEQWEKDGVKHSKMLVMAEQFDFIRGAKKTEGAGEHQPGPQDDTPF